MDPIPGPHTHTTKTETSEPKPKSNNSSAIAPAVIVPIVVVLVLVLGFFCYRKRSRSNAQSRRWASFQSFFHRHGYHDAGNSDYTNAPEKRRRRRQKHKVSVALPSAPTSAAARQTSARQLNETDLGPYGFVAQDDAYPMHDRSTHRRGTRPSSFRSTQTLSTRNDRSLKDFMLYDSNDSEDDGMDDDEDYKVVHGTSFYDANRGSLVGNGGAGAKMLVVPGATEHTDPLRHGDGTDRLAQSRTRSTRRGEERALVASMRDEEEMGMMSSPGSRHMRDSSASYAHSAGSADDYGRGSQAHLFVGRSGYGDSEGYGDVPPSLLPTSTFSLRPPTSAVTRQHHFEANLSPTPSAEPRPLTLKKKRSSRASDY